MKRLIHQLIPDEPFFTDDARYSGPLPSSVKYWCIIAIGLNAAVSVIGIAVMRNLAPVIIACLFALFPGYMLLFWRDVISISNNAVSKMDARSDLPFMLPALSIEWVGVCLAIGSSIMSIAVTVAVGLNHP
jgi:hypothetical protein